MRKFKLFFYPFYLIIAFAVLYFSIDILANMDLYKEKIDFATLRKLPEYLLYLFLLVSLLMLTELVSENVHILNMKKKVRAAEAEVLKLKAKLYDRSLGEVGEASEAEDMDENPGDTDNEEGDEDEEEYKI